MNELEYNREESSGSESMLKAMQDQGATYREEDLATNLDWIEASGKVYQMNNNGEKFQGDYRALAKYGIDQMSEFNYNVAMGMIPDVLAVEKADPETQMSFAYLMDTYDKKDITLDGFGRAVKESFFDPTNWLGAVTLGSGFAMKKGAQELAKEGLKNRLHNSIRNYLTSGLAVGATEGAIYSAGDTIAREMIQTDAGLREGVSGTDVAISGAIGAGVGAGLGKGIEVASPYVAKGVKAVGKEAITRGLSAYEKSPANPLMYFDAYHGTPHNVDKFSMDKVGTGHGEQAYGHGLYFSSDKDTASLYKKQDGNLYKVDLKLNEEDFIQWEKSLSSQSEKVKSAFEKWFIKDKDLQFLDAVKDFDLGNQKAMKEKGFNIFDYSGSAGQLYERIASLYSPKKASNVLKSLGVKGSAYIGDMADGAESKARNFVIFDDNDIEILEKNNVKIKKEAK